MDCIGLLELSDPVQFEPVGQVTAVFYDVKNQQVFSVRSGGATGIVVKSPGNFGAKTLVLPEDKGSLISIALSPDQKVLSLQRRKHFIDFYNVEPSGQLDPVEYCQQARGKNAAILGFFWSAPDEVVFVTESGMDIYTITPHKKIIKYVRSSSASVNWFVYCPQSGLLVTSQKPEATSLQVWHIRNSTIYKLPAIELGTNSSSSNSSSSSSSHSTPVREKDVSILSIYSYSFIRVNGPQQENITKKIQLYSVANDQVSLAHVLAVHVAGAVGVQVLDSLVLVHSLQDSKTQMFDIATPGSPYQENPAVALHSPVLPHCSISEKSGHVLSYCPTWVVFLPNILVDAKRGHMWTIQLKLKRAYSPDRVRLVRFLLNREGGKGPLLTTLREAVTDTSIQLHQFSLMFGDVLLAYQRHHSPPGTSELTPSCQIRTSPAVVIDQPDIFTAVLAPAEKEGVSPERLEGILVELLLSLAMLRLPARQFILQMFLSIMVKSEQFYQLHQYIQYGVITDSKHFACLLLSLAGVYPPARQIALDMLFRLGTAVEELIEICLSEGKVIQALNLGRENGMSDLVAARKFLDTADRLGDSLTFYNVFTFFEERNLRLKGRPTFGPEERCETFVNKFKQMFLEQGTK